MRKIWWLATLLTLALPLWGQQPDGPPGGMRQLPGESVVGKVTSAGKDSLTIAPLTGGDAITVKIDTNTRIFRMNGPQDRQPAKLEDIKTDDTIFARGELKSNVIQAARVMVVNPQMIQMFGEGGGPGPGGPQMRFNREDLGKKFIAGEVKAINETKITIARPDNQSQDIEVDENTSFKKGGESITLPDIKIGDFVRGPGELKDGVFVPKELMVGRPQARMMMLGPDGKAPDAPPGEKAAQPPQPQPSPKP